MTSPHFFNENLQLLVAQTYAKLENKAKAKLILNDLITRNLLKEQAEKLLKELNEKTKKNEQ